MVSDFQGILSTYDVKRFRIRAQEKLFSSEDSISRERLKLVTELAKAC